MMMIIIMMMMTRVSANSPPRFLLDTNVGSEIVLRLAEGETENKSILRWGKYRYTFFKVGRHRDTFRTQGVMSRPVRIASFSDLSLGSAMRP